MNHEERGTLATWPLATEKRKKVMLAAAMDYGLWSGCWVLALGLLVVRSFDVLSGSSLAGHPPTARCGAAEVAGVS
jgi:hypothetical protein